MNKVNVKSEAGSWYAVGTGTLAGTRGPLATWDGAIRAAMDMVGEEFAARTGDCMQEGETPAAFHLRRFRNLPPSVQGLCGVLLGALRRMPA